MKIQQNIVNNELIVCLEGRLDSTTAPDLETELKTIAENVTAVIFDLKDLEYISSAGLRTLLSVRRRMTGKGDVIVRNACEMVLEVFEITGFNNVLTIE